MKTIFGYTNSGLLIAALFAVGAVTGFAQDNCADAAGQTTLYETFLAKFPDKSIAARKSWIELGKQFLDKYGACESAKINVDYFKDSIPKWETAVKKMEADKAKSDLLSRFDTALKAKNWDDAYASGKEILSKYPEEFRTAEIVLGSIGGEEAFKGNFKYNDDALRFAKQSITDLEAGKSFVVGKDTRYGLSLKDVYNFAYPTKEDTIGWMNLYIGYITQVGLKNKPAALPYLFKASQATASETSKNSISFELIGSYYIDELNKVYDEIQALAKTQSDTDTEEVAKQKLEAIKAKVATANGTAERAMDAYARASRLAKDPVIKARTRKIVEDVYKRRFEKTTGLDEWIAIRVVKPFPDPLTPIAPVRDPEPAVTTTTTTSTTPPATPKPVAPPTVKPASAPGIKPAAPAAGKPGAAAKPQARVKKPVVKKRAV